MKWNFLGFHNWPAAHGRLDEAKSATVFRAADSATLPRDMCEGCVCWREASTCRQVQVEDWEADAQTRGGGGYETYPDCIVWRNCCPILFFDHIGVPLPKLDVEVMHPMADLKGPSATMKDLTLDDVRAKFAERFGAFTEDERRAFKQRFVIHDYEIFHGDILLGTLDLATCVPTFCWGVDEIKRHLRKVFLYDDSAVFVGYNNKNFDNKITDAVIDGAGIDTLKQLCDDLITGTALDVPWRSGERGRGRPDWLGRTFDIGFDIGQRKIGVPPNERKIPEIGLKRWERLNGYTVSHCPIAFDKRNLTQYDRKMVQKYNLDDLCATAMLLLSDEAWNPCLNARRVLVDDYADKGVSWEVTKPRIAAIVLNAKEENYTVPETWQDEHYEIPREIRIWKHRDILAAYRDKTLGTLRAMSSRKAGGTGVVIKPVCGIPHVYGIGGVHGCPTGVWSAKGGGIYSLDAASLYPNIMRHYGFLSRRVIGDDRALFGNLIDLRTKVYKPRGDKRAEGLKLVLNGCFGSMGFEKSDMYDPAYFCGVTITGQLLMTDLLEKLERQIELIQSNTDGIFFRLRDTSGAGLEECRQIVAAFERRTHLEMEWTEFESMYQRDISNYVAREMPKAGKPAGTGKLKKKGTWYSIKHCTVTPYLFESRVYSALNDGKTMPTEGLEIDRFAIELKRDKNSECFSVDGRPDYREWLDVVPVRANANCAQHIEVICKDDGKMEDSLFGDMGDDLQYRKRRKATGCPQYAALASSVEIADIDLSWYAKEKAISPWSGEMECSLFD